MNSRDGNVPNMPSDSEQSIEKQIQDKGLDAPRLTPEQIHATIVQEQYYVFPGTTVTVCCLTLVNGFNVVGESAAASPENFDEDIGKQHDPSSDPDCDHAGPQCEGRDDAGGHGGPEARRRLHQWARGPDQGSRGPGRGTPEEIDRLDSLTPGSIPLGGSGG